MRTAATVTTMARIPRWTIILAAAVVASAAGTAVLGSVLTAGPDRPDRAEVIAALKRDPRTADVPHPAAECVADWYLTYAPDDQLAALLDGADGVDATTEANLSPQAQTAILECLKEAT
ncbi:hypothetical protein Van01_38010 [Micromonospora andamanensis]|uniref:Uncharacterized protein n=2 Tax=Micromonospora andamanensis TaxID=1287068 RepID=A0ABQ4HY96_9ACTN|nr:hypothetical protein Van01_38010 [Micromonospora andamanensis]